MVFVTAGAGICHSGNNHIPDAIVALSSSSVRHLDFTTAVRARRLIILPVVGQSNDLGRILCKVPVSALKQSLCKPAFGEKPKRHAVALLSIRLWKFGILFRRREACDSRPTERHRYYSHCYIDHRILQLRLARRMWLVQNDCSSTLSKSTGLGRI